MRPTIESFSVSRTEFPIQLKKTKKNFILLELMIALFLLGLCALPLIRLPTLTLKEEIHSAWRIEMHRIADQAFANFKEDLYTHKINWDTIVQSTEEKIKVCEDEVALALPPVGKRIFKRKGFLSSVGKKNKNGEELYLLTFRVAFECKDNFKLFRTRNAKTKSIFYTYQVTAGQSKKGAETPPVVSHQGSAEPQSQPRHSQPTIKGNSH